MTEKPLRVGHGAPMCSATSKQTGKPCGNYAMKDTTVCKHHGGKSPGAQLSAARRRRSRELEAESKALLAHEGLEGIDDPVEALSRLATASMAMQTSIGQRVNALSSVSTTDDFGKKQLADEIALFERAMDRTGRFLDQLAKHGYTERKIKLAESQAAIVTGVIRRAIMAAGLSQEQQKAVQEAIADEFRTVDLLGDDSVLHTE